MELNLMRYVADRLTKRGDLTLSEIATQTGISIRSLQKIQAGQADGMAYCRIDRLAQYFRARRKGKR
jgi:transcriptional regulator with XRE-family HTH domain